VAGAFLIDGATLASNLKGGRMGLEQTPDTRLAYLENLVHTQGVIINEMREALSEQGLNVSPRPDEMQKDD
jgi:hypothetical protein